MNYVTFRIYLWGIVLLMGILAAILVHQYFACRHITDSQAKTLIFQRPEVSQFMVDTTKFYGRPFILAGGQDPKNIVVEVGSQLPDHNAAYGWYTVNRCSGQVKHLPY